MENVKSSLRRRSFTKSFLVYASYWYMIGPAFGLALQLYINYRFGLVNLLGSATYPDVICIFSCIVLVGYFVATFFVKLRRRRKVLALGAALCGVLAMVGMELPHTLGISSDIWAPISMFLFSLFLMTHLLLWIKVFACHDNMLNLIYILLLTALASFICWFLLGLTGPRLLCALAGTTILACATLLKSLRGTSELNSPQADKRTPARPLVGILVVTFFFGLGFMYTTSFMSLEDFHNIFDWTIALYALALCAAVLMFSRQIRISTLYYLAAPITIAGILLTLFSNPLIVSPSILSNIGFFTYLVFVLVLYCAISREHNSEPIRASCLLIIMLYLGIFAGRYLFLIVDSFIHTNTSSYLHTLIAVLIVVLLVVCTMIGLRIIEKIVSSELPRPQFAHITSYKSSEFSMRIAALYKLSDREQEVLRCMLENKTATEIARDMYIAHGTAKAHINNIYKKLDIHTREELFAMIPGGLK